MIKLKNLPYSRDTLKPTISKETISFHYDKHHKGYVDKLNKLIEGSHYESLSLENIVKESYISKDTKVFNNAAQIWNHDFYWNSIGVKNIPNPNINNIFSNEQLTDLNLDKSEETTEKNESVTKQDEEIENLPVSGIFKKIYEDFNSLDEFYDKFIEAGANLFGSGWIWLVQDKDTLKLEIIQTYNADSPMLHGKIAILTVDVWEHAYYIDYKNDRLSYLKNVIKFHLNWDFAKNNIQL